LSTAFALDTSCVIPLLSSWHEFHARTKHAYDARLARRERLIIPAHALLESFSVLTRMPVRLSAQDVRRLLDESFFETAEVAGLAAGSAWSSIQDFELARDGRRDYL
jgi:uncharacterized protein with PIN domain